MSFKKKRFCFAWVISYGAANPGSVIRDKYNERIQVKRYEEENTSKYLTTVSTDSAIVTQSAGADAPSGRLRANLTPRRLNKC
jgi:hypothetical protein